MTFISPSFLKQLLTGLVLCLELMTCIFWIADSNGVLFETKWNLNFQFKIFDDMQKLFLQFRCSANVNLAFLNVIISSKFPSLHSKIRYTDCPSQIGQYSWDLNTELVRKEVERP